MNTDLPSYENFKYGDESFRIRFLNNSDSDFASELISKVAKEMEDSGNKTYLHSKTSEEMENFILNDNNKLAGIFKLDCDGNEIALVGEMGYFGIPKDSTRNKECDWLPNFNATNINNSEISYVGSVCIDKSQRGRGFLKKMDSFLEKRSTNRYSVAMIDINNYASFGHFLDSGFSLTQKTIDPADNGDIFYFIKDIREKKQPKVFSSYAKLNDGVYKATLNSLLKSGFVGHSFDKVRKTIGFSYQDELLKKWGVRPTLRKNVNGSCETECRAVV